MPVDGDTELLRSVKAGLSLYVRLVLLRERLGYFRPELGTEWLL